MNIKNYSSTIAYTDSINTVKELLIQAHARDILERYENGICVGIAFVIPLYNQHFTFELPARINEITEHFKKNRRMSHKTAHEQALKTGWALIRDWVKIQLTMILLEQAEPLELFFPYLTDGKQTYYERIKQSDFKLLTQ